MQPMLTCKPLSFSQNVYWLDASVTDVQAKVSIFNTIYSVDYNLLHRHLDHPSKDILSNAKSKMKGFPQELQIPTDTPVCPGCVTPSFIHASKSYVLIGHESALFHILHVPVSASLIVLTRPPFSPPCHLAVNMCLIVL
jgi:hypothetical protein